MTSCRRKLCATAGCPPEKCRPRCTRVIYGFLLKRLLNEFINDYYHVARPHQGLNGDTPVGHEKPKPIDGPGRLISFPVCGGPHHRYERQAA